MSTPMPALPTISAALDDTFRSTPDLGELIAIDDDTRLVLTPSGGEVVLSWVPERETVLLSASVGAPRPDQAQTAFEMALDHNCALPEVRSQWIARMPESGELLLISELCAAQCTPALLRQQLADFDADRALWTQALLDLDAEEPAAPMPSDVLRA